jgi:hypothetical protein
MKKRVRVLLIASVLILIAASGFAPCWYPETYTVEYWQYHASCEWHEGPPSFWICNTWYSLDGTCAFACDGSQSCSGDTHIDSTTITDIVNEQQCPEQCS